MVILGFKSIDALYDSINKGKVLLENMNSLASSAEIDQALFTVYTESVFSNIPQCNCGKYTEAYLEGEVCEDCGDTIESVINKNYPLVWLRRYKSTQRFISPYFWMVLRNILSSKLDVLRFLSDTKYNPAVTQPLWLKKFLTITHFKRGYNNLVECLDDLLAFTISSSEFKTGKKFEELQILRNIWNMQKDDILSEYLGIFNKRLFVIEETKMGHYTSLILGEVKDICYNYILNNNETVTQAKQEAVTARLISSMATVMEQYIRDNLQGKPGDFRKHFSGARMPFSFRAVIRSMNNDSHRDELHVPWTIGVTTMRAHVLNLLVNRMDYSALDASNLLFEHTKKYHKDIDECFKILIAESPFAGFVVFFTRNPSLPMGSTQMKIITLVKPDVYDNTISISNLTVKPFNADQPMTKCFNNVDFNDYADPKKHAA